VKYMVRWKKRRAKRWSFVVFQNKKNADHAYLEHYLDEQVVRVQMWKLLGES